MKSLQGTNSALNNVILYGLNVRKCKSNAVVHDTI